MTLYGSLLNRIVIPTLNCVAGIICVWCSFRNLKQEHYIITDFSFHEFQNSRLVALAVELVEVQVDLGLYLGGYGFSPVLGHGPYAFFERAKALFSGLVDELLFSVRGLSLVGMAGDQMRVGFLLEVRRER